MTSANPGHTYSMSIGRLIKAPIASVFDAWLDAGLLRIWMKPRPEVLTEVRTDFRVGGTFRIVMRANGQEEVHEGVYQLIERPHRLRFSWSSGPAGPDTDVNVSLLASAGEATMLLLRHDGLKTRHAQESHREGWRRIIDRLAETLQKGPFGGSQ